MIKANVLARITAMKQGKVSQILKLYKQVRSLSAGGSLGDVAVRFPSLLSGSMDRLFKGLSFSFGTLDGNKLKEAVNKVCDDPDSPLDYDALMDAYNSIS